MGAYFSTLATPPWATLGQASGDYIQPIGQISGTYQAANNTAYFLPFFIAPGRTLGIVGAHTTIVGTAGAVLRVGLYADNGGVPGNLIQDFSTIDTSVGPGVLSLTIPSPPVLSGGVYHFCCAPQGSPATPATFVCNLGDSHTKYPVGGSGAGNGAGILYQPGVAGALPATVAGRYLTPISQMPACWFRLS